MAPVACGSYVVHWKRSGRRTSPIGRWTAVVVVGGAVVVVFGGVRVVVVEGVVVMGP